MKKIFILFSLLIAIYITPEAEAFETINCPVLTQNLTTGASNPEVLSLQTFLTNQQLLEPGNQTGYFGLKTQKAVGAYQCTALQICADETSGFGTVGPKTRAAITQSCTRSQLSSIATTSPNTVASKFITDYFSYIHGQNQAPLSLEKALARLASTSPLIVAWTVINDGKLVKKIFPAKNTLDSLSDDEFVTYLYSIILKRQPDAAGKKFHLEQLGSGVYRRELLARFLNSAELIAKKPDFLRHGLIKNPNRTKPLGIHSNKSSRSNVAHSFTSSEKIVMTHFFYWYNIQTGEHITNNDGSDSLTTHPSSYPTFTNPIFSYTNVAWYEKELKDMIAAGIDVMLPVYWGFPNNEHVKNKWSNAIFVPLEQAMKNLEAEGLTPPKVGMFLDTSVFQHNPQKYLDLRTKDDGAIAGLIAADFFSQLPVNRWAMIDNQPIVVTYGSTFTKKYNAVGFIALDDAVRTHLGANPYLIADASWKEIPRDATSAWGGAVRGTTIFGNVAQFGPGYDDENVAGRVRTYRDREAGKFYQKNWERVINSDAKIAIIETWNEFHEGSDIADSKEYNRQYINDTKKYVDIWKRLNFETKPTSRATLVDHMYQCVIERKGENAGLRNWNNLSATSTLTALQKNFFTSKEYIAKKTTNEYFVSQLYRCGLWRSGSVSERTGWVNSLQTKTRVTVLNEFFNSREFTDIAKALASSTQLRP